MVQTARPSSDVVDGAWIKGSGGNTDMYAEIDEVTASDTDYIESEAGPSASACAVGLSSVNDPVSSIGHILRYRYQNSASGGLNINLLIQLRQGYVSEASLGTLIAETTILSIPTSFTSGSITLSAAEADAITNYGSLFLRLVATQV